MVTRDIVKFPDVRSFSVPSRESQWIAIYHFMTEEEEQAADTSGGNGKMSKFEKLKSAYKPANLTLYNALSRQSFTYENVYGYDLSENGRLLAFQQTGSRHVASNCHLQHGNSR